jgi:hypothetical protein
MPVSAAEVLIKLATTAGAAGNANTSTPGSSLGKYVSTTQLTDNTVDNLFLDITGDENAASNVDYQCLFVHNSNASISLTNVVLWLVSEVAGGASVALGVDTTAASALASASAQALQIANKNTAPAGVSFSAPSTKASGISLGTIAPGQVKAFWVRRTAANSAALNSDGGTWRVEGDTAA